MKIKSVLLIVLLCFVLLVSCSSEIGSRTIEIIIPLHPWEKQSTGGMWYTLSWTDNGEIKTRHIDKNTRKTSISVHNGGTTVICAYPLDRLNPIGAMIGPADESETVTLNHEQGWFAGILINLDSRVSASVNPSKIMKRAAEVTKDVRNLDRILFIKDVLNGKLSDSSFSLLNKTTVGPLIVPDGLWISENINDPSFISTDGQSPSFLLPAGTYSWYCQKLELEYVISTDSEGNATTSTRRTKMT